jgi:hypothetical protein
VRDKIIEEVEMIQNELEDIKETNNEIHSDVSKTLKLIKSEAREDSLKGALKNLPILERDEKTRKPLKPIVKRYDRDLNTPNRQPNPSLNLSRIYS